MASRNHRVGDTPVNAFHIGNEYLFRHYFDGDAVYARLRRYYENQQYRFAVPAAEFDSVHRFLDEHGYVLEPVHTLDDYVVAVRKYTGHPDNIFKTSVLQRSHGNYTLFVLKDKGAVGRAVADGATRLRNSALSITFEEQMPLSALNG